MSPLPGSFLVTLKPGETTGEQFVELMRAEARIGGVNPSKLSDRIFGSASRWGTLVRTSGPVRIQTVNRAIEWLESLPRRSELEGLDALKEAAARWESVRGSGAPARVDDSRPLPASPFSAAVLLKEIEAFLDESGMTSSEFTARALGWSTGLSPLRQVTNVQAATARKIRDFIAKKPTPARPSGHAVTVSAVASARMRDAAEERHREILAQRALSERAHATRRPGETLADRFRRLNAELEGEAAAEEAADQAARIEQQLDEIVDPSALIRRAARDWPGQAATVRRFAADEGLKVGEAWHRVIVAGLEALTRGDA